MSGPKNHSPQQIPFQPQKIDQQFAQFAAKINEHAQALEIGILRDSQQQQILDQYRVAIYNLELKNELLVKMLEEKGIMAKNELNQRWPLYLKNDIGVIGPDGKMEGNLKVTIYG
jgi:hypothetical protein